MRVGSSTVGIPQALLYYTYFPAWRAFFEELGLAVVSSGPTNRRILDAGVELTITDACVPIKLMHGHIAALVEKGVDYLFLPRVVCTNGRTVYCPKFLGLPDMVRASDVGACRIISPRIDAREGQGNFTKAAVEVARAVGAGERLAVRALGAARQVHGRYRRALLSGVLPCDGQDTVSSGSAAALTPPRKDAEPVLRLAVVGYPYVVHDAYLNLDLMAKLRGLRAEAVTSDRLEPGTWLKYRAQLAKDLFWTFSEETVLAGYHYFDHPELVDGVIHVTAFGCGPDSVADKLLSLRAEERGDAPYLDLMVDEHTGEAGIGTRLEAFTDMIRRRKRGVFGGRPSVAPAAIPAAGATRPRRRYSRRLRRVTFPHLGTLPEVFNEVLSEMGNEVVMPPRPSRQTLTLGTALAPEFACLPLKILLGTYLEAIQRGADTIVSSGGVGPCRAGLYTMLHEKILRSAGHDVEVLTLEPPMVDLRDFLGQWNALNVRRLPVWRLASLVMRAWRKVQVLDELELLSYRVRAAEAERGRTSRVWEEAKAAVYAARNRREIEIARTRVLGELQAVPRRPGYVPLRVGIVGEIYVLVEPASNFELEEYLGNMGVETVRAIYMSGWTRTSNLFGRPDQRNDHDAERAAQGYLGEMIGGHGQESVGNAVLFAQAGFDGVIQLAPFTCIPEIVAKSVLERVSRERGIPLLSLSLDEQTGQAGLETRLEAFVDLLQRKREMFRPAAPSRPAESVETAGLLPDWPQAVGGNPNAPLRRHD